MNLQTSSPLCGEACVNPQTSSPLCGEACVNLQSSSPLCGEARINQVVFPRGRGAFWIETLANRVVEVVNEKATLNPEIANALSRGGVIDITTHGAKSGKPRRIEIGFHNIDGKIFISGMPGFPPRLAR